MASEDENSEFYLRYYVGHKGKFGHEFLEFEFRPDGKLRYANNSNYKNDTIIRKEVYLTPAVLRECRRIISESEVPTFSFCFLFAFLPLSRFLYFCYNFLVKQEFNKVVFFLSNFVQEKIKLIRVCCFSTLFLRNYVLKIGNPGFCIYFGSFYCPSSRTKLSSTSTF